MPKNYTENYQLNQWEPGDRVHHDDFNEDNRKIDAALAELQANQLRIHTGKYLGEGAFEKTIPLPFRPQFFWLQRLNSSDRRIMIFGDTAMQVFEEDGVYKAVSNGSAANNGSGAVVTVNDDSVHLRAVSFGTDSDKRQGAMNANGFFYYYVALG